METQFQRCAGAGVGIMEFFPAAKRLCHKFMNRFPTSKCAPDQLSAKSTALAMTSFGNQPRAGGSLVVSIAGRGFLATLGFGGSPVFGGVSGFSFIDPGFFSAKKSRIICAL